MGREIRYVTKDWQHPRDSDGNFIPLFEGHSAKMMLSGRKAEKWDEGFMEDYKNGGWKPKDADRTESWEDWHGERPDPADYMPEWLEEEKTHMMLYENTTDGTPETPAFRRDDLEGLCEYAAKHCTTFANYTATKERWMEMLSQGLVFHQSGNIAFI